MPYMGDPQVNELIEKNMRNCNIIWLAIFWFTLLIAVGSYFLPNYIIIPFEGSGKMDARIFFYSLLCVSFIELGVLVFIRKILAKPMYKLGDLPADFEARSEYMTRLFQFYRVYVIVPSAIGVSIAIYGLILVLMQFPFNMAVPFFALSVAGLFMAKPRMSDIENVLSQL